MKKFRRFVVLIVVLLILISGGVLLCCHYCVGVTHADLSRQIDRESAVIREHVDVRCGELDAKLGRVEAKLDRIEAKLDKLIEMATPKLPEGMRAAD